MIMKPTAQELLEIAPDLEDRQVANLLARLALEHTDPPYRFAINHDIRPPKNQACPVQYDWTRKDRCGIETMVKPTAAKWLTEVLVHGYTVYLMSAQRKESVFSCSISRARRNAAWHQRPKAEKDHDDDIPF